MWGMGLRLKAAGGTQECLWPWRAEDQVQDPSSSLGPSGWGNARCVPPDPPIWRATPRWPLFFFPPSLPPMLLRPMWPEGSWEAGDQTQKPNRLPGAERLGGMPAALHLIPRPSRVPLSASPTLPPSSLPPMPLEPTRPEGAPEYGGGKAPEPSRLPGARVGRGNAVHTSPDPLIPEGPSLIRLSSSSPASLLHP